MNYNILEGISSSEVESSNSCKTVLNFIIVSPRAQSRGLKQLSGIIF